MSPTQSQERSGLAPLPLSEIGASPLVSVLVANYNYEHYIADALESLEVQTYDHFEVIVCDDGSTDHSRERIQAFCARDERFLLVSQKNAGVAAALNTAYDRSSGALIALLDADDTFEREKLARLVQVARTHAEAGFFQHDLNVIDGAGRFIRLQSGSDQHETGWLASKIIERGGRWRNRPASALAFRRELAELLFPMPAAEFRTAADAFLFTLGPLLTSVAHLPEVLGAYRLHGTNVTGSDSISLPSTLKQIDALERITVGVNQRLQVLVGEGFDLKLANHLNYNEALFTRCLLNPTPFSERYRFFIRLIRAMVKDDVYSLPRKLAGMVAYLIAWLSPLVYRENVLSFILGGRGVRRLFLR